MIEYPLLDRRGLILAGAATMTGALASSSLLRPVAARGPQLVAGSKAPVPRPRDVVAPALFERALAALQRHLGAIKQRDRVAIVDFSASSSAPRFHFLDVAKGRVANMLVAHGSGSDPHHTGFAERFSNAPGSNASSEGAFVTGDYYEGKHGRSQRLRGLDPSNDNALERAIVVHGAWYADADMLRTHGKLGRSQGCFAVGENDLQAVFDHLGEGALIYAARA
jgi:hypothetical protein